VDLQNVRAFVAVAESSQFQVAGARLGISQQAVSKRVASLERELGLRLFARTPRGALLTLDGQVLLPRAKELLRAEARALAAVRPDRRSLRVDVINVRLAPGQLVRDFHEHHPDLAFDVVTMFDAASAIEAVSAGALDLPGGAAPGLPASQRRPGPARLG
jgi:DNA-binding transcriptional LysR family regulator